MGRAAKSNDEYRAYLGTIMPLYSNFTVCASGLIQEVMAKLLAGDGTRGDT